MNHSLNKFSKEELKETLNLLNNLNPSTSNYKNESLDKYKIIRTTFNLSLNGLKQLLNYYLKNSSVPICKICNKEGIYFTKKKLSNCCSSACLLVYARIKSKQTCLEKYGVESTNSLIEIKQKKKQTYLEKYGNEHITKTYYFKNKSKQTCLEKYGVDNSMKLKETKDKIKKNCLEKYGVESTNSLIEIKQKKKQTCINNYGVSSPMQSEHFKTKSKQTCMEKYGVEHSLQSKVVREKSKLTNLEKYGASVYVKSKIFKDKILKGFLEKFNVLLSARKLSLISIINESPKIFNLKCNICNHEFELNYNNQIYITCRKCNPYSRSKLELEIYDYLTKNKIEVLSNDRSTIKNEQTNCFLELDLFIPSKSLAIEINGIYWHSANTTTEDHLLSSKHLNKYLLCKEQNITLLQFTDLDFINKPEICYSIINSKININQTKIFARKCSIKLINNKESIEFLNSNHIQGYAPSKINLGLFYNLELIQIMTFSKSRFNKKYNYELIRLCSKINYQVLGGSEKLFKYFKDNYLKENESIISYCDISKFNGSVYNKLNFKEIHQSSPNYFYYKNGILESRQKFQKHKLKSILKENFNPNLTEKENMINNGYSIYYDCGNKVYEHKNLLNNF